MGRCPLDLGHSMRWSFESSSLNGLRSGTVGVWRASVITGPPMWVGNHRSLLRPLCFPLTILVGRALACGNLIEGAPLRVRPHAGVAGEHGARDVPSDTYPEGVRDGVSESWYLGTRHLAVAIMAKERTRVGIEIRSR